MSAENTTIAQNASASDHGIVRTPAAGNADLASNAELGRAATLTGMDASSLRDLYTISSSDSVSSADYSDADSSERGSW